MNTKVICSRCKSEIKRIVETCQICLKDFHPSCTKEHKILNRDGKSVICEGNCELFNRTIIGNKTYRRSRKWDDPHDQEELEEEKTMTNRNKSNNNNDNNAKTKKNEMKCDDLSKVIDDYMEKINDKIDKMHLENIKELKHHVKTCVSQELLTMEGSLKDVIKKEIENVKEAFISELQKISKIIQSSSTVISTKGNNYRNQGNQDMSTNMEPKKSLERVVVIPTQKQESAITMSQLTNRVDIIGLGIGVNKMKTGIDGKIILEVEEEREKAILAKEIQEKLGDKYKVNVSNKKNPKVKIVGLEDSIVNSNGEIFINNLIKQNHIILNNSNKDDVKLLKLFKNNKGIGTAILEVKPELHKKILTNTHVKIGWKNCKAFDYINAVRCFKCWGFNHFANKCTKGTTCRICAGNHKEAECQSLVKKCVNCVEWAKKHNLKDWQIDHVATDRHCECYKKILLHEQTKITVNKQ